MKEDIAQVTPKVQKKMLKTFQKQLQAVQESGIALQYASDKAKNNERIVLKAVQENWRALEWASDEMKGDREIVMAAVRQDWVAHKFGTKHNAHRGVFRIVHILRCCSGRPHLLVV